jgi:hypothetical protein
MPEGKSTTKNYIYCDQTTRKKDVEENRQRNRWIEMGRNRQTLESSSSSNLRPSARHWLVEMSKMKRPQRGFHVGPVCQQKHTERETAGRAAPNRTTQKWTSHVIRRTKYRVPRRSETPGCTLAFPFYLDVFIRWIDNMFLLGLKSYD